MKKWLYSVVTAVALFLLAALGFARPNSIAKVHADTINDVPDYRQAPVKTALSEKLAKDLKKRGFKFTGPVAVLSFLQAAGLVDDHENDCEWKSGNK